MIEPNIKTTYITNYKYVLICVKYIFFSRNTLIQTNKRLVQPLSFGSFDLSTYFCLFESILLLLPCLQQTGCIRMPLAHYPAKGCSNPHYNYVWSVSLISKVIDRKSQRFGPDSTHDLPLLRPTLPLTTGVVFKHL